MRHNTLNTMEVLPYRSKMACTPAMALRRFSSFEKTGAFSAGPEAGMAAAATRRWLLADHTRKQDFQTRPLDEVEHLVDALRCCLFPVSTNNRRRHKALVLR